MSTLSDFMDTLVKRNPGEKEFHDAVYEVTHTIFPFIANKPVYQQQKILERLTEPDRIISFRVAWQADDGSVHVNRGWRVQHNNAIGPYKGGIRFHSNVTQSILKFLAFEQTFKNSLTGLPLGGGKGGSNFNPKGKSDAEVMRFCQAFMTELYHNIGSNMDVPAGDIGVGAREIGYMFGQYKRLTRQFTGGVLTGKGLEYGGSLIRTEATGYGAVIFLCNMLAATANDIEGKRILISGSGNVATYAAQKAIHLGAKVISLSDSSGTVYDSEGIDEEKLETVKHIKQVKRGRIKEYLEYFPNAEYIEGGKPWGIKADIAMPCATQNEIDEEDAKSLVKNGCIAVVEGANMPSTMSAMRVFQEANILFGPSKAVNAGGVAVSGIEMSQNSMRLSMSAREVELQLTDIMENIHHMCEEYGRVDTKHIDYVRGANIAGFMKVSKAMQAYGIM